MSQPVPTGTQAGWGGDSADTGMSAADMARDWGEQEAAIQPRIIEPAGQAPKALAAVPEAQQAGGAEAAAPPGAGGWRQLAARAAPWLPLWPVTLPGARAYSCLPALSCKTHHAPSLPWHSA